MRVSLVSAAALEGVLEPEWMRAGAPVGSALTGNPVDTVVGGGGVGLTTFPVLVGNVEVMARADTGASVSVLSSAVWDRIPASVRARWATRTVAGLTVTSACGGTMPVTCVAAVPLKVAVTRGTQMRARQHVVPLRVVVCDLRTEQLLVGLEVLASRSNHLGVLHAAAMREHVAFSSPSLGELETELAAYSAHLGEAERDIAAQFTVSVPDSGDDEDLLDVLAGKVEDAGKKVDADALVEQLMAGVDVELTPVQDAAARDVIRRRAAVFGPLRADEYPPGLVAVKTVEGYDEKLHAVDLGARHVPPARVAPLVAALEEMIKVGILQRAPENARWYLPLLTVEKKGGGLRPVLDASRVNKYLEEGTYRTMTVDQCIAATRGAKYFTVGDCRAGFHQWRLEPEARRLFCFRVPPSCKTSLGTRLCYARVVMGATASPSEFARLLDGVLRPVTETGDVVQFADDMLAQGTTVEGHLAVVDKMLACLEAANVKLDPAKFKYLRSSITFLGEVIKGDGSRMIEPSRLQGWRDMQRPKSVAELRSVLGAAGYLRQSVPQLGTLMAPLHSLVVPGARLDKTWQPEHTASFEAVRHAILTASARYVFDAALPTIVRSDASNVGWGGTLVQVGADGRERHIAFVSRKWKDNETRWSTIEQECRGLLGTVLALDDYLSGLKFVAEVDARNLEFMRTSVNPRVRRWATTLAPYNMTVRHIAGTANAVCDALSRLGSADDGAAASGGGEAETVGKKLDIVPTDKDDVAATTSPATLAALAVTTRRAGARGTASASDVDGGKVTDKPPAAPVDKAKPVDKVMNKVTGKAAAADGAAAEAAAESDGGERGSEGGALLSVPALVPVATPDLMRRIVAAQEGAPAEEREQWTTSLGCKLQNRGGHRVWCSRDDVLVPQGARELKDTILLLAHSFGHFGQQRVRGLLKDAQLWWVGMKADVAAAVAACHSCQKHKADKRADKSGWLHGTRAARPLAVMVADYVGALTPCAMEGGGVATHVLVTVDKYSRYVELSACGEPNGAVSVALLEQRFNRYSAPSALMSDGGSHLANAAVAAMCRRWGIEHHIGTPERPQGVGAVERRNKEVGDALKALPADRKDAWVQELARIAAHLNQTVNRALGVSPHEVLFGVPPRTPLAVAADALAPHYETLRARVEDMARMRRVVEHAQVKAAAADAFNHNAGREAAEYEADDRVLLRVKPRGAKLDKQRYRGPYRIVGKTGAETYKVEHAVSGRARKAHVTQMRKEDAGYGPIHADGEEEEDNVWQVEDIVAHEGKGKKRRYCVKWLGCGVEENTWEPASSFADGNVVLRAYRDAHGLA